MSVLVTVGAVAIGLVSTVVLLTGILLGWTWASEKLKDPVLEPFLPLSLLVVVLLNCWILNATTGDAGVFGVLLGIVAWMALLYHYHRKQRAPKNQWERFLSWAKRR